MSDNNYEQRQAIKFCVKLGETATVTFEKLKRAYGDDSLSRAQVFRWHKAFSDGRKSVQDDPRSGRPLSSKSDENVGKIRDLVRNDRRLTTRMIAEELDLNHTTVHQVLREELNMRKVCAKLVPKILTVQQKDNRMEICRDLLGRMERDSDFLKHVITGDESWIFEYDPETKRQSKEWHTSNSPRPKKARMSKSKVKTMLISFFDSNGIVHKEFLPTGQTVNQNVYLGILGRLRKRVMRVRPAIKDNWMLHHDNAPCHTALSITEFLTRKNIPVVPQPPYSPDLSPCDFFLFPKLKSYLKGHHFGTIENIKENVTAQLKDIPVSAFQHCYEEWENRMKRCVASQGNYFEGDRVHI